MASAYPQPGSTHTGAPLPASGAEGVDVRTLLAGIWSRKPLILGIVVALVLATFAVLLWITPKYSSEARVLISNRETAFTRVQPNQVTRPADPQAVKSQVQVLLSHDLAIRTVRDLKLADNPEFNSAAKKFNLWNSMASMFGIKVKSEKKSSEQRAVRTFVGNLDVYAVPESRVIVVDYTSKSPETAAMVVNTLSKTYIKSTREAKLEATQHATKWLSERAATLRSELTKSEREVETFRAQAGLVRGSNGQRLDSQTLTEMNRQIILAAAAKSETQARARNIRRLIRSKDGIDSAAAVLNSNLIQRLAEQKAVLRRQIADLGSRYLSSHPNMVRIKAEIQGLDGQIKSEARKIAASLDSQTRVAGVREASLRASLAQMKTRSSVDDKEQVRLNALEREAKAKRDLLQSFLGRLRDAAARQDVESQTPGARIISHASVSNIPSFPKKGPIMLLAVLGALMIGTMVAFVLELFAMPHAAAIPSPPHRAAAPVQEPAVAAQQPVPPAPAPKHGDVPIIGHLTPAYAGQSEALGANAEIFGPVASAIQSNRAATGSSRILITADRSDPADTAASIDLARTLGTGGHSVLLIDADFRNPAIEVAAKLAPGAGLADLLRGGATFSDVIVSDNGTGVHLMRAGTQAAEARAELTSDKLETLLGALQEVYEYILIFAGPTGQYSDIPAIAAKATTVIVVSHDQRAAQPSIDQIKAAGQINIGILLRQKPGLMANLRRNLPNR